MQNSSQNKMAVQPVAPLMFRIGLPIVLFSVYEKMLQATGRSLYSTIAQIAGAMVNIILDPFLIYGWCGLPELGVRGAAWATVIGQLVSMGLGLAFHLHFDVEIDNSLRCFKPDSRTILGIYSIGLPAIISQALLTVMTYSLNLILGGIPQVGQNAVTVYGLYYKIQQLIIFAAFGVRDAITPIVSFNYGAQNRQRVKDGIRWGLVYTAVIMLAGCIGVEAFAPQLAGLFSLSETTLPMCIDCMRIVSLGFVFAGLCVRRPLHRFSGRVPGAGMRHRIADHLAVPSGHLHPAAGMAAQPHRHRRRECAHRLAAAGSGRSRDAGHCPAAVPPGKEAESGCDPRVK